MNSRLALPENRLPLAANEHYQLKMLHRDGTTYINFARLDLIGQHRS